MIPPALPSPDDVDASSVDVLLKLVREQLGMDVAFVTRFNGARRQFRNIDAVIPTGPVVPGYADELEHTFCQYIVDGRIEQVTPDALLLDPVASLPETQAFGIRSYIGVPLTQTDGHVYGTLCAFSQQPDSELGDREARVLSALAPVLLRMIDQEDALRKSTSEKLGAIQSVLDDGGPTPVFQPVIHLGTGDVAGWEALSRFPAGTPSPAEWFSAAQATKQTVALETAAITAAIEAFDATDGFLAVNVSEQTLVSDDLSRLLQSVPLDRMIFEVTEHSIINDYPSLLKALNTLRSAGARVAIDDTGAGYSTFQHVLALEPELIKLDISLIRGIDHDRRRQALVAAIGVFGAQTDSLVLAEGIETAQELACLQYLGIDLGQGYLLGRPGTSARTGLH